MKMQKRYTVEESIEAMKNDPLMCQIVRVAKMVVPDAKIYTDACYDACLYNVFLLDVPRETCESIGQMIREDYTVDRANDVWDYPFLIDHTSDAQCLIDITDLV